MSRRSVLNREAANSSAVKQINEDKESIITQQKLKRFNEAQGTVAGNMNDEVEVAIEALQAEADGIAAAEEAEEAQDEVAS